MDSPMGSLVLPVFQTVLTGLVLAYVKWTREDIQAAVKSIEDVKSVVAVNTGRISHLEQMGDYQNKSTHERLMAVTGRASDLASDVERIEATISLCPNCPHPGQHGKGGQ